MDAKHRRLSGSRVLHIVRLLSRDTRITYGVGLFIIDIPGLLIVNTWFLERRGLAYGLMFGATDLFGSALTFLAQALLQKYGLKG